MLLDSIPIQYSPENDYEIEENIKEEEATALLSYKKLDLQKNKPTVSLLGRFLSWSKPKKRKNFEQFSNAKEAMDENQDWWTKYYASMEVNTSTIYIYHLLRV